MNNYVAPEFLSEAFNCPFCNVCAQMSWKPLIYSTKLGYEHTKFQMCSCSHCSKNSYWLESEETFINGKMILPTDSIAPLPHLDMPESIKEDYLEARNIVNHSPRGASALLRLVIQKLCVELGGKGKNIEDDIAFLVKNGLSKRIQSILDIVKVVGNNAVHPGNLSKDDISEIAITLFGLVNFIVEDLISKPREIEELYVNVVPEKIRNKRTDAITE